LLRGKEAQKKDAEQLSKGQVTNASQRSKGKIFSPKKKKKIQKSVHLEKVAQW